MTDEIESILQSDVFTPAFSALSLRVFSPQPLALSHGSGFATHPNIKGIKNNQIVQQSSDCQKIVGVFKQRLTWEEFSTDVENV